MSVLGFSFHCLYIFWGIEWNCELVHTFERGHETQTRGCYRPFLWIFNRHIFRRHWKMVYFCPNGGHTFQIFLEKNKTLNGFRAELPAGCHALIQNVQVLVFPVHSVGFVPFWPSAVCTYYVILPSNHKAFCLFLQHVPDFFANISYHYPLVLDTGQKPKIFIII